jgi:hypothetical protein
MFYKGHSEVKVDIMLLLVANNCWTRSLALGYWLFYFSSVLFWLRWGKTTFAGKRLSKVSIICCHIYPCSYWGQSIFVTVSNYIVSSQLIAGSIMVRHMLLIIDLSLPLRVYYLMRCTQNTLWGVIMNSFDSTLSYFGCVSCFGKICKIWCYWMVCAHFFSTSQILLSLGDLSG